MGKRARETPVRAADLSDFILREWLLFSGFLGVAATSLYLGRLPSFPASQLQVLALLWILFVVIQGLRAGGAVSWFARVLEGGRLLSLKLVLGTFFLSALVTNDVALVLIVPLTLSLNIEKKDILVVLEALAANAGSALTPFGNPQNLLIYWYYRLDPGSFMAAILPFSGAFLVLLAAGALAVKTGKRKGEPGPFPAVERSAWLYGILLVWVDLVILRVLPFAAAAPVLLYPLLADRRAFRVDYLLLATFFFFFGAADNLRFLLASELAHRSHVFLLSSLTSQVMSNVPSALLFSRFTLHWKALLWGVNVGGFGSLMASFANLIAYRFYLAREGREKGSWFTLMFVGLGYAMFFAGMGLYWAVGWFR